MSMGRHFPARCLLSELTHSRLVPPSTHQRSTETTIILQPPPLFHMWSRIIASLTSLSCFCFEPIHVHFGGLNTTKWRHKSAIIHSQGRAPHHQFQGTPMADQSQPYYLRRCRAPKALLTIAISHFLHSRELCLLIIMPQGGIAPIQKLAHLLLIPLHPHLSKPKTCSVAQRWSKASREKTTSRARDTFG
jgi:hypothetical protein